MPERMGDPRATDVWLGGRCLVIEDICVRITVDDLAWGPTLAWPSTHRRPIRTPQRRWTATDVRAIPGQADRPGDGPWLGQRTPSHVKSTEHRMEETKTPIAEPKPPITA